MGALVARLKHEPEVDALIAAWTRQHDKREAMRVLGGAGVPAGSIFDTLEPTEDAAIGQRGIMQTMEHPTIGQFKMPGWPVRFGGRTPEVKPSPPVTVLAIPLAGRATATLCAAVQPTASFLRRW